MQQYEYKAFISYRHQSPDQDVAKKLHTMIESFAVPAALKKAGGISRMGRVFRDQEELPLSSDLGEDIHRALENSEWLICICSPAYLESRWCMEELNYFISLGRRDRILTVLVSGEPEEAFPKQLRFAEEGGVTVEKEPLAADVRAASLGETLRKLKNEKLRIIAPMLGVNYDDLKQRARQRRNHMIMAAGAAVVAVLAGFLGYAFHKNAQITSERNEALIAESKWLAKSANETLDSGDKMLSLLLSLEALPEDFEHPNRPVTKEALESLWSAIISGQGINRYVPSTVITVPGLESFRGYGNRLYCFSRQTEGFVAAYDMITGRQTETAFTVSEEPAELLFSSEEGCYCVYGDRITRSNASQSGRILSDPGDNTVYSAYGSSNALTKTEWNLSECENGNYMLWSQFKGIFRDGKLCDYEWLGADAGYDISQVRPLSGSRTFYMSGSAGDLTKDSGHIAISLLHPDIRLQNNVAQSYTLTGPLVTENRPYLRFFDVSPDGTIIAGDSTDELYFWSRYSQEPILKLPVYDMFGCWIAKGKMYFSPVENGILAFLTEQGKVYIYDCLEERIVRELTAGLSKITDFMWNSDGTRLLMTCNDGKARIVSAADGETLQSLDCSFPLEKALYANTDCYDNSSSDGYILLTGGEHIQIYVLSAEASESALVDRCSALTAGYYTYNDSKELLKSVSFSEDGSVVLCRQKDGVYVVDSQTMDTRAVLGKENAYSSLEAAGQRFFVIRGDLSENGTGNETLLRVYDAKTYSVISEIRPRYGHKYEFSSNGKTYTSDRSELYSITGASLDRADSMMAVYGSLYDPSVFVYDTDSFSELWHICLESAEETDRLFDFASEWEGYISPVCRFMNDGFTLLVMYEYNPGGGLSIFSGRSNEAVNMAFELRDAVSGDIKSVWHLPYKLCSVQYGTANDILTVADENGAIHYISASDGSELAEEDVPVQPDGVFGDSYFTAGSDGLYDADTGSALMHWKEGQYIYISASKDGSNLLCLAPYSLNNSFCEGDAVLIRSEQPAILRELALRILDGRQLGSEEKARYYLK